MLQRVNQHPIIHVETEKLLKYLLKNMSEKGNQTGY